MKNLLVVTIGLVFVLMQSCEGNSKFPTILLAVESGDLNDVKWHLNHGADINMRDEYGNSILAVSIQNGYEEIAMYLVSRGADVNITDTRGRSSLYWAAYWNLPEIAAKLLQAGANVNERTSGTSQTPLIIAAAEGNIEVASILLKNGADVNAKDSFRTTPLENAMISRNIELVELLKSYGGTE